ncbi:MAG: 4-amino-4-deoxy-L-arabinose transferase and related glycosyltransferase of family [Chthonomonadaceae bacterium]|nr:4-amino-4-deoxy-L-arabinose transferase and related glycosyltransferase of family [Chthonomonadaceae bacterium]
MSTQEDPPTRTPQFAFHSRWRSLTLWFVILSTGLRLLQLSSLELAPDEAYYWDWSRHLSLGYYDQGPFVAYLIRATTAVFGTNAFGVRIGVLFCSLGTLLCAVYLARRLFSPLAGFLTALLLGLTPLLEVGSLIATYDPPLVFFWALAAVCLEHALFSETDRERNLAWAATGLATGLGFLSKHTMLLIMPCLVLFLLLAPRQRRWLLRPQPYLALLLTLLCYTGVFVWNAHHHWWTFGHLLFLTHKSSDAPVRRIGDYLGSQAVLLGPGLFLATLAVSVPPFLNVWKSLRPSHSEETAADQAQAHALFLACLGLPVFAFFTLMAFKAKVQGNWAVCAWLTPTILFAGWSARAMEQSAQRCKKQIRLIAVIGLLSLLPTVLLVSPPLRLLLGIHLKPDADISNTAYGWREVAGRVQQVREAMAREGHAHVFIAGNGYQYPALLAFYLPDHPETEDMFIHNRLTMYAAYVENLKGKNGYDAIYVNENQVEDMPLRYQFERVEWERPLPIYRRPYSSEPIRTVYIARCYGYRHYMGLDLHQGG